MFSFPFFNAENLALIFFFLANFHVFLIQDFSLDLQCRPVAVLAESLVPPELSL